VLPIRPNTTHRQLVLEASPPLSKGPDSSSLTPGWRPGLQLVSLTSSSTSSSSSAGQQQVHITADRGSSSSSSSSSSGSKASVGSGSSVISEQRVSKQQHLAPAWQRAQQERTQAAACGASAGSSSSSGGSLHGKGSVSVGLPASPGSTYAAAFDITLPTDQGGATAWGEY
jgi:hypothetical protein